MSLDGLAAPAPAPADRPPSDASTDGADVERRDGNVADAGVDADTSRRFCERQSPGGLVFCDDFDLSNQTAAQLWTEVQKDSRGSLEIVPVAGRSRALAVSVVSSGSAPIAALIKELPRALSTKDRLDLSWSFAVVDSSLQYAAIGFLAFTDGTTAIFNGVAAYQAAQKVGPLAAVAGRPLPRLVWTTARVLFVRQNDRFVRSTFIDGTELQTVTLPPLGASGMGVHLAFGAMHTSSNPGAHELLIDDVVLRAE